MLLLHVLLHVDIWGPACWAQEVLVLLSFTLRGAKGKNADARAENVARMASLFVTALLIISSFPSLPFAGQREEVRVEWIAYPSPRGSTGRAEVTASIAFAILGW